jgi:hypothetical protein
MCKTSPEKVAPLEIVTDRRLRPNPGCPRGDNDPKFFHTPRRVPFQLARHTAKNGRQCHSFLTPFVTPTRKLNCDEADCWEFTALACQLCKAEGAYRGPGGTTLVFMTFGKITMSKPGAK